MSNKPKLLLWGAGGQGKMVSDIAIALAAFSEIAFIDDRPNVSVPAGIFLGGSASLADLQQRGYESFVVSIGENQARALCYARARTAGLNPLVLVHPSAIVSPTARIGFGTVVMPGAVINAGAVVGENVIVNTAAVIEHDCVIGDHAHISPGTVLGGGVIVGRFAHLGLGCIALPNARIGENSVIGAGGVVLDFVPDNVTAAGVPVRILHQRAEADRL